MSRFVDLSQGATPVKNPIDVRPTQSLFRASGSRELRETTRVSSLWVSSSKARIPPSPLMGGGQGADALDANGRVMPFSSTPVPWQGMESASVED